MKSILTAIIATIVGCCVEAADGESISFATAEDTSAARRLLLQIGVVKFMDVAWSSNVDAPPVYSRYFVDTHMASNEQRRIELSRRDFALALLKAVDEMAIEISSHPNRELEPSRLDWLLRFSEWMGKPAKFENFRIASRAEAAATIPLLRVVVDMDVPDNSIENFLSRFMTVRASAVKRAQILYEESNGQFDIRKHAKNFTGDFDGFEGKWFPFYKKAYQASGLLHRNPVEKRPSMPGTDTAQSFFLDDDPNGKLCDSECWDMKLHKAICIFRDQPSFLRPIVNVFEFRKLTGEFPEVHVAPGEDPYRAYKQYYNRMFRTCWREHGIYPGTAAGYYLAAKDNSYIDEQTRHLKNQLLRRH